MAVYISDGKTEIGAVKIPERKKPCLSIRRGNVLEVYGYFISDEKAEEFMDELANLIWNRERRTE